jgi:hypothetical protein
VTRTRGPELCPSPAPYRGGGSDHDNSGWLDSQARRRGSTRIYTWVAAVGFTDRLKRLTVANATRYAIA